MCWEVKDHTFSHVKICQFNQGSVHAVIHPKLLSHRRRQRHATSTMKTLIHVYACMCNNTGGEGKQIIGKRDNVYF